MRTIIFFFVVQFSTFGFINSQNLQFNPFNIFNGFNYQQNPQNYQQRPQNYQSRPPNNQQNFYYPQQQNYQQPQAFDNRGQTSAQINRPNQASINTGSRISERKCNEYLEKSKNSVFVGSLSLIPNIQGIQTDQCDASQGLIIGGENAKAGEFPHMAAIGYRNFENFISFRCGGSLISERFVLTAAHCRKADRVAPSVVRLGDLNLKVREPSLPEKDVNIESFIYHELYDPNKSKNDIAVIKLAQNVQITKTIRPACLMNSELRKNKAIATGWGLTESLTDKTADIMQKVELTVLPNAECIKIFEENGIDDKQLCAGEKEGGKDTCQGDSGGPLQIVSEKNKCLYVIIGITSYGSTFCGAANSPGVYTKVSAYIDWIEQKVWGST